MSMFPLFFKPGSVCVCDVRLTEIGISAFSMTITAFKTKTTFKSIDALV
jgi:hypothetical protein